MNRYRPAPKKEIRTIEREDGIWWVLADVCKVLNLSNAPVVSNRLEDDEVMTISFNDSHSGKRGGAQTALAEAGIQLCSGAQGNTDEVVEAYLKGELESAGTTCDHHHEEGHSCGNHEEGESCGSSCGGCGSHKPAFSGPNVGKTCRTHYKGTFNDGTQFDSSYDRGQPLEFVCGAGQMIKGFDAAVADMKVGEIKEIHLMPEDAYGQPNPDAIFTLEIEQLPGAEDLTVGQQVYLSNQYGQPFPVKVTAKDEKTITFDANHEMAGKELNFKIELVEVK